MKKSKAKLTALILALSCCAACAGAGVALVKPQNATYTVNAEDYTIHDLGQLAVHRNSDGTNSNTPNATQLYMKIASGMAIPYPDKNWDTEFILESGAGWKLNGNDVAVSDIESTNSGLFVNLANANVQVGDVLSVEGTFVCPEDGVMAKYIIAESKFTWNGTAWANYVEYTTYELGAVKFQQASGKTVYFQPVSGSVTKADDGNNGWTARYMWKDGVGVTVNDTKVSMGIKFPGSIFVDLDAEPSVGDILKIGGTFYNTDTATQYVITETAFKWDGNKWEKYVTYETYTVTKVGATRDSNASTLYLYTAEGDALPKETHGSWDHAYTLVEGSGLTLNGAAVPGGDVKLPGDLYMQIGASANVNDIITIDGAYVNEDKGVKLVFVNCQLQWNGEKWVEVAAEPDEPEVPDVPDVPEIEYTTYTITKVGGWISGDQTFLYSLGGDALPKATGEWDSRYTFEDGSGSGIIFNGEAVSLSDIKQPGDLFVRLSGTPVEGDTLTIDGTFYNEAKAQKFVFVNCMVKFDGTVWVAYVPEATYETYTVTGVGANADSTASVVYLYSTKGDTLPKDKGDWETICSFEAGSGAGVKLNDTTITPTIKLPGDMYVPLGADAVAGDIFTIDGTYYNEAKGFKIVFDNCQLQFNGEKWIAYAEPTEVVVHDLGALAVHDNSNGVSSNTPKATQLYMKIKNGTALPYQDGNWETEFTLESGAGWKLNGDDVTSFVKDLESTNAGLFANLEAVNVQVGDILSVEGTFFSADVNAKYIIAESRFLWNGTTWENYVEYTTHVINGLSFQMIGNEGLYGYFLQANGDGLPVYSTENNLHWETEFKWKEGVGIAINGETVKAVVKFPNCLFVAFPNLPKVGDVLTIAGTFYSEALTTQYVVSESQFEWAGAMWIPVIDYTEYTITDLDVIANQTSNSSVTLTQANGESFASSNTYKFLGGTGLGIAINGLSTSVDKINVSAKEIYVDLGFAVNDGDVLTIDGAFYHVNDAVKYLIQDCNFIYTDGVWAVYESNYNEVGVGEVKIVDDASTNKYIYFAPVDETIVLPVNSWDDAFVCAYGLGVTLNGEVIDAEILSIDDTIYVALSKGAEVNDVLTISGKFVCDTQGVLYFVNESAFVWNGEAWEKHINYRYIEVGKLNLYGNSATINSAASNVLQLTSKTYTFAKQEFNLTYESGIGLTVNGEQREWSIFKNHKDGYLYLKMDAVNEGDVVKIGGSFICPETAVKYVIEESTFTWEGFWNFECEKVNVGAVTFHSNQPDQDNALHVAPLSNGVVLPVNDWLAPFVCVAGNGITLNGEPINYENHVKSLGASIYIAIARAPQEGDVLVIDGTLRSAQHGIDYVFEESILVYTNNAWVNQLYGEQSAKREAVEAYFNTFTESDYYETEWATIEEILQEARGNIEKATTKAAVQAAYDKAIAEMDAVAKKADVDANFAQWVADAKAELEVYKNADEYRAAEQAQIAAIVAQAKADIDACTSWTALNKTVKDAKAALDALFTDAEWTAAEDYAVAAKETLANYKAQANYKEAEWNAIQTIIANAYAKIDEVMADASAVDKVVSDAKASMDKVKTAVQVNAEMAVVAAAKAELAAYKSESNYNAPEWAEIQSIIERAYANIDEAIGDSEEIADIVANAKAQMDKVLNSEAADAKAFADAKAKVEAEIRAYVNSIDYSYYSDEGAAQVNAYITAAVDKVANATTYADFEGVVDELKAQVESVEKIKKASKGCFGTVTGLTTGVTLAAAAALVLRKKKED